LPVAVGGRISRCSSTSTTSEKPLVFIGQIIASGATLSDYPEAEQILEVCHRTGKFPFLFINEDLLAIEESGSAWHPTTATDDLFPTVKSKFRTHTGSADMVADFDTGASAVFVDYDFLIKQKVIQLKAQEEGESAQHPNRTFGCLPRKLTVEIVLASGEACSLESKIWAPLRPHKKEKSQLTSS
jgi:hypothetical protein